MINDILFKRVAYLVDKVNMHIGIIRVNLAATLINRHEYRLDTACCLRHQTGCARRRNGQTGYVAAAIFSHILIQLRICLLYTVDERIVLLALSIINFKSTALLGHFH